ncbi:MAG: hypothetical protein Fur0012_08690 [Elusimicrobiota bacterium]
MKKGKILIVSDYLFGEFEGGAARVSTSLSEALALSFEVKLLLRGLSGYPEREMFKGIEVFRYFSRLPRFFSFLREIFSSKISAVNLHDPYGAFWTVIYLKLSGLRVPCVYTFHSPWSEEYGIRAAKKGHSFLRRWLCSWLRSSAEGFALRHCDKIIAESFYMSEKLKSLHGLQCEILKLGTDTKKFFPSEALQKKILRKKFSLPEDKKVFFTLRNLEPRMGIENLIKAVSMLDEEIIRNSFFLIAGKGSMRKELSDLIESLNLSGVCRLYGFVEEKDLPDLYRACDAFILPTYELEGFGLISAEAMSSGLPVLATPVGANIQVVSALDPSLLFEGRESRDIANGIKKFMSLKDVSELGARARLCAEKNYSFSEYASKMEKILDELSHM